MLELEKRLTNLVILLLNPVLMLQSNLFSFELERKNFLLKIVDLLFFLVQLVKRVMPVLRALGTSYILAVVILLVCPLSLIIFLCSLLEGVNNLVILCLLHGCLLLILLNLFRHERYFLDHHRMLFALLMAAEVRPDTHIVRRTVLNQSTRVVRLNNVDFLLSRCGTDSIRDVVILLEHGRLLLGYGRYSLGSRVSLREHAHHVILRQAIIHRVLLLLLLQLLLLGIVVVALEANLLLMLVRANRNDLLLATGLLGYAGTGRAVVRLLVCVIVLEHFLGNFLAIYSISTDAIWTRHMIASSKALHHFLLVLNLLMEQARAF